MPSPTRPSRRTLLLFLTCLLLSFFLQLPLAWAFCLLASTLQPNLSGIQLLAPAGIDTDTELISIAAASSPGFRMVLVTAHPPGTLPRRYWEHHATTPNSPDIKAMATPWNPIDLYPALASDNAWPARTGVYSRPNMIYTVQPTTRYAAGWPFLCAEGRLDYDGKVHTFSGIITDPRFAPTPGNTLGYLVYHPRWPAYLANTLIHATLLTALLLLLNLTFQSLRAHHRQKRNHCPTCNYDLRATPPNQPCPECGRASKRHD